MFVSEVHGCAHRNASRIDAGLKPAFLTTGHVDGHHAQFRPDLLRWKANLRLGIDGQHIDAEDFADIGGQDMQLGAGWQFRESGIAEPL